MGKLVAHVVSIWKSGQPVQTREVIELDLRTLSLDGVADRAQDDAAVALPLDEIVLHTAIQDLNREILVALATQHDNRDQVVGFPDPLDTLDAATVRKIEVEQHDVEPLLLECSHGIADQAGAR